VTEFAFFGSNNFECFLESPSAGLKGKMAESRRGAVMHRQDAGMIQIGGLTAQASWRYVDGLLCLRIPASPLSGEQWQEVERLCAETEPVFLLWNGSADSDHRIVGFERSAGVVTFFLTKKGLPSSSGTNDEPP
jgi:hypothetical protein